MEGPRAETASGLRTMKMSANHMEIRVGSEGRDFNELSPPRCPRKNTIDLIENITRPPSPMRINDKYRYKTLNFKKLRKMPKMPRAIFLSFSWAGWNFQNFRDQNLGHFREFETPIVGIMVRYKSFRDRSQNDRKNTIQKLGQPRFKNPSPTEIARAGGAAYVENEPKYRVFSYKKDDSENPSFLDAPADRSFTTGSTVR